MKRYLALLALLTSLLCAATSKRDEATGLIWQDNQAIPTEMDYPKALQYCQNLTLDGFSDWRLPKIKELATIADLTRSRPALKKGFDMRLSERFWSATPDAANPKNGWVLSFAYGEIESYPKRREYHVRCVRGGNGK